MIKENISVGTGDAALNRCLERTYDEFGRPTGYALKNGDVTEQNLVYSYDSFGQMVAVNADGKEFRYSYVPNAPYLVSQVISPIHTVTNTYEEKRDVLTSKTNSWKNKIDSPVISSYLYSVNNLGQRVSVETAGEAFGATPAPWAWNYDVLGQVIKANNNSYVYDSIGNRIETGKNGEVLLNYMSTNLNQYMLVGEIIPTYDFDGNLIKGLSPTAELPQRSTLRFIYNDENRPVKVSQNGEVIEEYAYDHGGRRVKKGNTIIIYDGYNAIAEYNLDSKVLKESYAWGLDLSNSTQGAGGVGGLLSVTDHTTQTPLISYPAYDGNGNISEYLIEVDNGSISAHYEYDAFGDVIKKTGTKDYSYQFSTKPFDSLTGLSYYNYRLYDSTNGRWINRDPIYEQGGLNLYNFIGNNSVNKWDKYGLVPQGPGCCTKTEAFWKNRGYSSYDDCAARDGQYYGFSEEVSSGLVLVGMGVFPISPPASMVLGSAAGADYTKKLAAQLRCGAQVCIEREKSEGLLIDETNLLFVKVCTFKYTCKSGHFTNWEWFRPEQLKDFKTHEKKITISNDQCCKDL